MSVRGLALLLALAPGMVRAEEAPTTREMRALSAHDADRRIRQDLLSILQPAGKIRRGNRITIGDLRLNARPYATRFRGLCRRDTIEIGYAPTEPGDADEDAPVRPYRVDTSHRYRFVAPPHRADIEDEGRPRSPFQNECGHAGNDEWAGWFTADEPRVAVLGAFAMQAVVEWARMPGHQTLSCDKEPTLCAREVVAAASLDRLSDIATCEAAKGELCYYVTTGGIELKIKARASAEIITAADILSVDAGYEIVVA